MIATEFGTTRWSTKEVATACQISPTSATTKLQQFEARLVRLISAVSSLDPSGRPDNQAKIVLTVLETGAKLAAFDREKMEQRLVELIGLQERNSATEPAR